MTHSDSFLAAVRANPDQDTPRLAYADWLDEHGEAARAAFIRAQIEHTRLPAADDRHSELHAAELRLLAAHGLAWTAGPPRMRTTRFRRGFAEFIAGSAADLIEQLPEAVALAPIRELWITNLAGGDGLGAKLAELPALAGVDSIAVDDMGGVQMSPAEEIVRLFASPHLRRVRKLTLFCGECTPDVFERLLALPALQHLESLYLNGGMDADQAIGVLTKYPALPLREFRAHKGPHGTWAMSRAGLSELGESPHWGRLEVLNVGIRPDPELLPHLAEGLNYGRIHTLCLHQGAPEADESGFFAYTVGGQDYGIEAFAAADAWGHVRDLRFEYIEMNGGQLPALLAAKPLAALARLSIFGGMVGPVQAAELFRCPALSGLQTLELSANFALGSGLAEHLAGATHLTNLTDLILIWVQGTDTVAEAIAGAPHFAKLRNLELANNYISAKGVTVLGESPHLGHVNRLRLFEHPYGPWQRLIGGPNPDTFRMSNAAAAALAGMPNLGCVELHGYDFPADSFDPLLAAGEKLWATADPRRIGSPPTRDAYARRTEQLWLPSLDAYLEEEERFP